MNIKRLTLAILFLVINLVITSCGSGGQPSLQPVSTETPNPTPMGGGVGQMIFVSNRDGGGLFYTLDINGSHVSPLKNSTVWSGFDNAWSDEDPTMSPDGKFIAFSSKRDDPDPHGCSLNCNYEIYMINSGSSKITRLTNTPQWDTEPAWSPDGKHIAFTSTRDGDFNIYVMDADGSNVTRLTEQNSHASTWSPDSKRIAFIYNPGNGRGIYVMDINGSNITKLTGLPSGISTTWRISWSPDGKYIVFVSDIDGLGIYIMDADGSNVKRLTENSTWMANPTWSPDGKFIAFTSNRDNPDSTFDLEIYTMAADGSQITRLTDVPAFYNSLIWLP